MALKRSHNDTNFKKPKIPKISNSPANGSIKELNYSPTGLPTPGSDQSLTSSSSESDNDESQRTGIDTNTKLLIESLSANEVKIKVPTFKNFRHSSSLEIEYKEYLHAYGITEFLVKYVPTTVTKRDICELILNLGYSKDHIRNYENMSTKEVAFTLLNLILNDEALRNLISNDILLNKKNDCSISGFITSLKNANRVLVITGAGISTSVGIPDFRSFTGLYAQLNYLNLTDPQQVFDYTSFKRDPSVFYQIANKILPPRGKYSILHSFIRLLQDKNKLLRNYTQNIDNLESNVGIKSEKLVQCHGSFGTASCITCRKKFKGSKIHNPIKNRQVPYCSECYSKKHPNNSSKSYGVIKPDITFFGEDLPQRFYDLLHNDINNCDLVLVIGTSLKVEPVSNIVDHIPDKVPQVLLNKDFIESKRFDLSLIGYCDDIVCYISKLLGSDWEIPHEDYKSNNKDILVTDADKANGIFKIGKKN